jgi:hypothetical protein
VTTPINRFASTFAIAGLLFMAPLMAMARMAAPTMPEHRAPDAQKRMTSNATNPRLPAGKAEAAETDR